MKTKKEKVFDAVLETIYEGGNIASLRVSDIAKRAGIGKGSVYMYFASKEQMLFEAAKYMVESVMLPIIEFEFDANDSFETTTKKFITEHIEALKKYSNIFYSISSTEFLPKLTHEFEEMMTGVISTIRNRYEVKIRELIDFGATRGEIAAHHSKFEILAVSQMLFSTSGYFWQKILPIVKTDMEDYIDMMYNMMVKMLK